MGTTPPRLLAPDSIHQNFDLQLRQNHSTQGGGEETPVLTSLSSPKDRRPRGRLFLNLLIPFDSCCLSFSQLG